MSTGKLERKCGIKKERARASEQATGQKSFQLWFVCLTKKERKYYRNTEISRYSFSQNAIVSDESFVNVKYTYTIITYQFRKKTGKTEEKQNSAVKTTISRIRLNLQRL